MSSTSPVPVDYGLYAKWTSTGYATFNEADRVVKFTIDRGRDTIFGDGFVQHDIGELHIELENYDDRYNPFSTGSPIYGQIVPGVEMQLRVTYASTVTKVLFTGHLEKISVKGYKNSASMIIQDGWRYLRDNNIQFGTGNGGACSTDCEIRDSYQNIINQLISEGDYPWSSNVTATSTDDPDVPLYWWYDDGTMKGFLEDLCAGSFGRVAIDVDGNIKFRKLGESSTSVVTLDEDICDKNPFLPINWDYYRSKVINKSWPSTGYWTGMENGYPFFAYLWESTVGVVVRSTSPLTETMLPFSTTDNLDIIDRFSTGVNMKVQQATGWSNNGDLGNNYVYASSSVNSTGIGFTISVASTVVATFYRVGWIPTSSFPTTDWFWESTDTNMRDAEFTMNHMWLNMIPSSAPETASTSIGTNTMQAALDNYWNAKRIEQVGQALITHLSTIRKYPVIQLRGRYEEQFAIDLEDKVTLVFPTMSLSGDYLVSKISHETMDTTQDVITTLWLYPEPTT